MDPVQIGTSYSQVTDVMDLFELRHPDRQLIIKMDYSAGHAKQKDDGLHVSNMNVNWGGKQKFLRDSKVSAEGLGVLPAFQDIMDASGNIVTVDCKLKPGDTQSFTFNELDLPPRFDADAPRVTAIDAINPHKTVKGRKRKNGPPPEDRIVDNWILGYVGAAKDAPNSVGARIVPARNDCG